MYVAIIPTGLNVRAIFLYIIFNLTMVNALIMCAYVETQKIKNFAV